jgi:nucleotide-binding universal stress UspA family protein
MGLRRHSRAERVLHDETTLNVIRSSPCPVLGVTETGGNLLGRTLAAMDFTAVSLTAANAARAITVPTGRLTLVYVPTLINDSLEDGEGTIHALGVEAGFARAQEELARERFSLDQVVLHHPLGRWVADVLLEYAEGSGARLISTGSGPPSRVDRGLLGSASADLVRDGRCGVLVSPPTAHAAAWTRKRTAAREA